MPKYFAKKIPYDGHTFDSRTERDRYVILKMLQKAGEIKDLELQKCFELLPKQMRTEIVQLKTKTKTVERVDEQAVHYHCDFYYTETDTGTHVIEEVKSKMTAQIRDYPLRRKLIKLMVARMNRENPNEHYKFVEHIKK